MVSVKRHFLRTREAQPHAIVAFGETHNCSEWRRRWGRSAITHPVIAAHRICAATCGDQAPLTGLHPHLRAIRPRTSILCSTSSVPPSRPVQPRRRGLQNEYTRGHRRRRRRFIDVLWSTCAHGHFGPGPPRHTNNRLAHGHEPIGLPQFQIARFSSASILSYTRQGPLKI